MIDELLNKDAVITIYLNFNIYKAKKKLTEKNNWRKSSKRRMLGLKKGKREREAKKKKLQESIKASKRKIVS